MKRTAKSLLAMLIVLTLLVAAVPFAMMSTAAVTDAQGNVWSVSSDRISGVTLADGVDPATAVLTLPTGYTALWSADDWPDVKKYIIPDGYTTVFNATAYPAPFKGMTNLEEVVFPEGMTSIGTFEGCTNLKCIKIPMSVTETSTPDIFKGCTSLVSVDLGGLGRLTYLPEYGIFENNPSLKFIYANSNITPRKLVGNSADMVGDPTQGITIVVGENVTSINGSTFNKMYINEVVWNSNTFSFGDLGAWFHDCVFVGGSISAGNNNLYRSFFSNSISPAANAQVRTVDGKFDIYFGAGATYAGNVSRPFLPMNNWNAADEINLYYEGAETLGVENYIYYVDDGGQKLTPTINVHTNASAYQYRYNNENFDETKLGETPTQDGYVFAGYNGEDPIWVDDAVLSVKAQLLEGTDINSETTSIRFLSTTDALTYKNVGFKIEVEGCTPYRFKSKNVYTAVKALGLDVSAADLSECDDSEYIFGVNLSNIQYYDFETPITVTPFWTAPNGMIAEGVSRTVTVADLLA